jgi:hypothetical protein
VEEEGGGGGGLKTRGTPRVCKDGTEGTVATIACVVCCPNINKK